MQLLLILWALLYVAILLYLSLWTFSRNLRYISKTTTAMTTRARIMMLSVTEMTIVCRDLDRVVCVGATAGVLLACGLLLVGVGILLAAGGRSHVRVFS